MVLSKFKEISLEKKISSLDELLLPSTLSIKYYAEK